MCHIVKDVASLITMSSLNHSLTALSQRVSHFKHDGFTLLSSTNWHVLHLYGTSWRSPKYTGNIHGMFVAGVVTKRKGFSSVLILSMKKQTNRTLHRDPPCSQRLGQSHYNKEMVVINCMNFPKYTLFIGYISLSSGGWRKIIIIDLRW